MEQINPLFQRISEGRALAPLSPSPELQMPKSRPNVPPLVKKVIGELGLRFQPSAQADLEAHALALALLASDVSDVPASLLEAACREHVRISRFMPKAAELIDLARQIQGREAKGTDSGADQLQRHCDRLNAMNGGREGWHVVGIAPNRTIAKSRDHVGKPS